MKINALNSASMAVRRSYAVSRPESPEPQQMSKRYGIISFKGGNVKHAGFWGMELPPYSKVGGVGTVLEDFRSLRVSSDAPVADKNSFGYWKQSDKFFANPLYNSAMHYNNEGVMTGLEVERIPAELPDGNPFKPYAGQYFMTNNVRYRNYLNASDFFNNESGLQLDRNVFLIEDVTGGNKMLDFGDTGETKIRLFRSLKKNPETNVLEPINDFHVWVDLTASFKKPYEGGGYASSSSPLAQSWKGDASAKASKAFVEFLPRISELTGIDPATIIANDMQSAQVANYMAQKTADGTEYFKGKHPSLITHNTQEGYIERTSNLNMFVDIADKELREAVAKDPKLKEAAMKGPEAVEDYFKALLPQELLDSHGIPSQFMVGAYYTKQGYMPLMNGVSEKYIEKAATDPNFIPSVYPTLNELYTKKKLIGINNGFENQGLTPYKVPGFPGYKDEQKFTINDKEFVISPFRAYDANEVNAEKVNMAHFKEISNHNKISLMQRFNPELMEGLKNNGKKNDLNKIIAGFQDKEVDVYGYIDPEYVEKIKNGEDVRIITSIGRGDKQKAFDSVLEAFEKYVLDCPDDKNTVLIMGGALNSEKDEESIKIKSVISRMMSNPKLKGRFVFNNGFSPNAPFFMAADISMVLSRFAPYELTDLESMKVMATPLVTNCQGLAQKNFDRYYNDEAAKATSYRTAHEFEMNLTTLKEQLDEEAAQKLERQINEFRSRLSKNYSITHNGATLADTEIDSMILKSAGLTEEYKNILRPYRDNVIVKETADKLKQAITDCGNDEIRTELIKKQLGLKTAWEENSALSATGLSSSELYRQKQINRTAGEIKPDETLLGKLRKNCEEILQKAKQRVENVPNSPTTNTPRKVSAKGWWIAATTAIAGLALGCWLANSTNKDIQKTEEKVEQDDNAKSANELAEEVKKED